MSILEYLKNDEGDISEKNLVDEVLDKTMEEDKKLSSIQRAKKKYMEKYTKTEKFKEMNRENVKKHYDQNSKKIYENRKKRMIENPELHKRFKEQQRMYSAKRREMLKIPQEE